MAEGKTIRDACEELVRIFGLEGQKVHSIQLNFYPDRATANVMLRVQEGPQLQRAVLVFQDYDIKPREVNLGLVDEHALEEEMVEILRRQGEGKGEPEEGQ